MSGLQNIKFKSLKTFGSTEWLANNEKNYRQVFDESEVGYVYCEFAAFNKFFDEQDWDLKLELKCLGIDNTEICSLNCDRKVRKEENIIFVREGWGVKDYGAYWKRGTYKWQVFVDGKYVDERYFYIVSDGRVDKDNNAYLRLITLKLYEGQDSNVKMGERKYFKAFNAQDTRYVWAELTAENLLRKHDNWPCELVFNFKTFSGNLIGRIEKLLFVYPQDEKIICTVGWGAENKGTWAMDDYYIEVVFMNRLISTVPFRIGYDYEEALDEDFEPRMPTYLQTGILETSKPSKKQAQTMEQVMSELNSLIGLETVKNRVTEYTSYLNFIKLRRQKGLKDAEKINLHAVFKGNPGTGKTTVARLLGKIYKQMGLLSKGHVHEVDRGELVAEYIGQTAPKTKEAIKKARGGILFIDEAYALARKDDDSKDFGKEAIEVILKEMSDGPGDLAVIVAGYPEPMDNFVDSNPGLKSRFSVTFEFPDYLPQELMQIAEFTAEKKFVKFDKLAKDVLYNKLVEAYRDRNKSFGNARLVNIYIDEAKMNLGLRIMKSKEPNKLSADELSTIQVEDVERIFEPRKAGLADIPVDEELLRESLAKLKSLVGLQRVKEEIDELVKLVRFYRESNKNFRQSFSLHAVFTGNPGTGKTTVARILSSIYKALGILERGNLVEVDRQGLVGAYIGQTAIKTGEVIDKAMGGVLFIDEAYSLTEGTNSDYGKEAIEIILKRMEDRRGEFVVIAAGYTQNMERFMESNPGLKSRFDRIFHFDDYNRQELYDIAMMKFAEYNVHPDNEAMELMDSYIGQLFDGKDRYFGNGREIRRLVEDVLKAQHLRLANVPLEERTPKMIETISAEDFKQLRIDEAKGRSRGIGFKRS